MANRIVDAVITTVARNKMLRARTGEITLPKIVGFVFGNGGVDGKGEVIAPDTTDIALKNEIYRKVIDRYVITSYTTCKYECTLENSELAGEKISEIGLYDADGDIVAIKAFSEKGKDADLEMTFQIEDIF